MNYFLSDQEPTAGDFVYHTKDSMLYVVRKVNRGGLSITPRGCGDMIRICPSNCILLKSSDKKHGGMI